MVNSFIISSLIHFLYLQAGFTDTFFDEVTRAGSVVKDAVEGSGFFINQKAWDDNFVYLPPVTVSPEYPYISGIAGIMPSPDWFTSFYLMETVNEQNQTYWDSFKIRTFPWDAGTDLGTHYEDPDNFSDLPRLVTRIQVGDTEDSIFLSPTGDEIQYVAEWECVLHTCPFEDPGCEKEDWPPLNGCDVLQNPGCSRPCDSASGVNCEDFIPTFSPSTNEPSVTATDEAHPTPSPPTLKPSLPQPTNGPTSNGGTTAPSMPCFDNLRDVQNTVAAKDQNAEERIVLCPNTVFNVDKQGPIQLRSNTHYLCGNDGSSSNDCQLVGGSFQVLNSPMSFGFEDGLNIYLHGITFESSTVTGAVLSNSGDVTFVDCIFRNHVGQGTVSILYIPGNERRTLDATAALNDNSLHMDCLENFYTTLLENATAWTQERSAVLHRRTEVDPLHGPRQVVNFNRCLFVSNAVSSNKFIPNSGIIQVKSGYNDIRIDSCRFLDNSAGEPSSTSVSFTVTVSPPVCSKSAQISFITHCLC